MGDVQVYLDREDDLLLVKWQKDLPKNTSGHSFPKKTILRDIIKRGLRDKKYREEIVKKYNSQKVTI